MKMQTQTCQVCGAEARFSAVHGVFCGAECQSTHWASLGAEAREEYVRVSKVDMHRVDLSREEMGRASWVFLHATFNKLEDDPATGALPRQARIDAIMLIYILTRTYPCKMCREHFAALVKQHPPDALKTAEEFQRWLCDAHNIVNRATGKKEVPFSEAPRLVACAMNN